MQESCLLKIKFSGEKKNLVKKIMKKVKNVYYKAYILWSVYKKIGASVKCMKCKSQWKKSKMADERKNVYKCLYIHSVLRSVYKKRYV